MQAEPITSIRSNPLKPAKIPEGLAVPWCENGTYLKERPSFTLDPLFHAGAYYVQEASSMFLWHVLQSLDLNGPTRYLDLCAAPGGKSTLMASLLKEDDVLLSNEYVRQRCGALRENLIKWGDPRVLISNNDPKSFEELEDFFDVIMVDAPCSGEGMFRKDEQAVEEWSQANVNMCAHRQQDILAAVWPSLREGGFLIYSTCTFNKQENEHQIEWLNAQFDIESVTLDVPESWNIHITQTEGISGYRFFPHRTQGEGFFLTVIRKAGQGVHRSIANRKQKPGNISNMNFPFEWLKKNYRESLIEDKGRVFLQHRSAEVHYLSQHLNLVLSAIPIAELKGKDWIPTAELALSTAINTEAFSILEVEKEDALRFLKTEDIKSTGQIGWNLISYQNTPLGWIKQLPNRANNYFPKEWKIRMDIR